MISVRLYIDILSVSEYWGGCVQYMVNSALVKRLSHTSANNNAGGMLWDAGTDPAASLAPQVVKITR